MEQITIEFLRTTYPDEITKDQFYRIFLTMANDTNFRKDVVKAIKENYKWHFPVFDTVIPATVRLGEISTKDKSIFKHDPNGKAAKAYANLVKEVQGIGEKQRIQPSDLSR